VIPRSFGHSEAQKRGRGEALQRNDEGMNQRRKLVLASVASVSCLVAAQAAQAQHDDYPKLGFEEKPAWLKPNELVLTFDDGPAWGDDTVHVLDILKEHKVKATFFVNTSQGIATDWDEWGKAKLAVQRIIDEGHGLATHTRTHAHLPGKDDAGLEDEIFGVEPEIKKYIKNAPRITLFRAPYGEPYQWKFQQDELEWEVDPGVSSYETIAPFAAERAVHIGWNIDTNDWRECGSGGDGTVAGEDSSTCVFDRLKALLDKGQYGVILMHSIQPRTVAALPKILDYLKSNDYKLVSVEQAVCNKYGATSANIVDKKSGCEGLDKEDGTGAGDGDVTSGDGDTSSGDGDVSSGDGDTSGGDGDGDGDSSGGQPGKTKSGGCSVETGGAGAGWLLAALPLALMVRRRRMR
jgi:peptidoglycan/xylan/chitin deacetylase (PgdA/CDA1 family)